VKNLEPFALIRERGNGQTEGYLGKKKKLLRGRNRVRKKTATHQTACREIINGKQQDEMVRRRV